MKLLLIEDNITIAQQIAKHLEGEQWSLDFAHTGTLGLQLLAQQDYDLLLLDLNLPDMDGLDVCQQIRRSAQSQLPILMLTARDAIADKAHGFDAGADDYLSKPFDLRELSMRCQALVRRSQSLHTQAIEIGELSLDLRTQTASRAGAPLNLTQIGFRILSVLGRAYPDAVSRSRLEREIWGEEPPDSDALKSHIYSLRQALDKPYSTAMLRTLINVGYRLEASNADQK